MKNRFYYLLLLVILIGTILLGAYYLFSGPESPGQAQVFQPEAHRETPPTSTPRPTATPIIPPAQNQVPGDLAYFYGDWEGALQSYQAVLETAQDPRQQAAALLGIGKVYYQTGEYQQALDTLRELTAEYPGYDALYKAYFTLAQTYRILERDLECARAYQAYLERRPGILEDMVQSRIGDAYARMGDRPAAITAYQSALAENPDNRFQIQLKIGEQYQALDDHQTAVTVFEDVYTQTGNDYVKARADYLLGISYLEMDQEEQAVAAFRDAVTRFPLSYDSYLSLLELVNGGYQVNDLHRGLVDYFAGQYSVAVEAFDRYLSSPEAEDPGTALYYKGFSLRAMGRHQEALQPWNQLIEDYPEHSYWDQAWEFKAYSQWFYLGLNNEASQTLQDFVTSSPFHPRAAEFLYDAGRVEERANHLEDAAALWRRVYQEYPTSAYANLALFKSGITHFRLGGYAKALDAFSLYRDASRDFEEQSQALFWIGKVHQRLGDEETARAAWLETANADPTGYYSERARDLLQGRQPFTPPSGYDLGYDVSAEQRQAQEWIRETFTIPEETNLEGLGMLAEDPRILRGTEMWELGLYEQARDEFERLREEVSYDPVSSYRLANYYQQIGLYRPAIFAARQVLNAEGMSDAETMNAPAYFNHIRFGPYYSELVIPAAQEYDLHPLLIFSVIRQESLFEGFVRSSAGARGLMQIIPSTGADIAEKEGWPPGYTAEDLYRPQVSVKFGAAYLAFLRSYFNGDIYATLAAYNGGLGNTTIWLEQSQGDPDLFLEIIRFSETQTYLKNISEIFAIYRRLYGRSQ
jgi:soluble lytic murein transglycosylase